MHASPSFQMDVCRFGQWRGLCILLAALAFLAWAAWAAQAVTLRPAAVAAGGVTLLVAALALWRWMRQWQPFSLRWDTQRWFLGAARTRGQEPVAGRIEVCLDLGDWLLLRFEPEGMRRWGLSQEGAWLPLQRRGHELPWHALRSTVYCARPVALPSAAPF
jgi:hypothetical protein